MSTDTAVMLWFVIGGTLSVVYYFIHMHFNLDNKLNMPVCPSLNGGYGYELIPVIQIAKIISNKLSQPSTSIALVAATNN